MRLTRGSRTSTSPSIAASIDKTRKRGLLREMGFQPPHYERVTINPMPAIGRVLETSLYVDHLSRSIDFYQRVFGFESLMSDNRFCALNVSSSQVLLLFVKHGTTEPITIPGGVIPPHDGDGQTHVAFTIVQEDETAWKEHLKGAGIAIESRVSWPRGGFSLYFRDPDGHLLELVTPGCWEIY